MPIPREELSGKVHEFLGRSTNYKKSIRTAGYHLVLAIFTFELLSVPWRYSAYLFLILFAFAAYRSLYGYQIKHFTKVFRKNGKIAFSIPSTERTEQERNDFRNYYAEWIKNEPTSQP